MGPSDVRLTGLRRYPVKSCRGEDLRACEVEPWGLLGDRRWMVVDPTGKMVSARAANRMLLIVPKITDRGLRLSTPGIADLMIERPQAGPLMGVKIFDDRLTARPADDSAADWFSAALGRPLRLVYLDDPRRRPINPRYAGPVEPVSLADGYPVLLAAEESLAQLNAWIADSPRAEEGPLPMVRFRPNFVVAGAEPFAEESWRRVRIGEVTFRVAKPCVRCVMTRIDPDTAVRSKEPLVSLARHHRIGGKLLFAVNLIPDAPYGTVRVGDELEVLERD